MNIDKNLAREIIENAKAQNKKVIFTNGCFDILHSGHVTYLEEAKKLGDILYYDKDKLRKVDEIIQPLVNAEIKKRLLDNRLNVVEQALMPDENFYDSVWYLYTDMEVRIKRLMLSRGLSRERIETIISKQPKESDFESIADNIIKNNGDRSELEKNIREALR